MIRRKLYRTAICALVVLPVAAPVRAQMPIAAVTTAADHLDRWQDFIAEAARRFDLPEAWIRAVILAESGGRTIRDGRPITSRAGAMGLMQVMPETYAAMRAAHHLGPDPYDPHDNILAGTAFLRTMFDRYGYPGLFAAYNAGPGRYDAYLQTGTPLPAETQAYIAGLNKAPSSPTMPPTVLSGTRLFFPLRTVSGANSDAAPAAPTPSSGGLFVPLRDKTNGAR